MPPREDTDPDMFENLHHIAFTTHDLKTDRQNLENVFELDPVYEGQSQDWGLDFVIYDGGNILVELVMPTVEEGYTYELMQEYGAGFNHVAFEVSDVAACSRELRDAGFSLVNEKPLAGVAWMQVTIEADETITRMQIVEDSRDSRFDFAEESLKYV